MNKNVVIAVTVGIIVIIGAVSFQIYESSYQRSSTEEYYASDKQATGEKNIKHVVYPENPQILYGLTINKDKYLLGENVFIKVQGIPMGLKDSVQFFTPKGVLYFELEFDGNEKSSTKHYFRPALTTMKTMSSEGLCGKEALIGEWTVMFASLPMEKLNFQVMDEILPHSEEYYLECDTKAIELPIMQPSLGK